MAALLREEAVQRSSPGKKLQREEDLSEGDEGTPSRRTTGQRCFEGLIDIVKRPSSSTPSPERNRRRTSTHYRDLLPRKGSDGGSTPPPSPVLATKRRPQQQPQLQKPLEDFDDNGDNHLRRYRETTSSSGSPQRQMRRLTLVEALIDVSPRFRRRSLAYQFSTTIPLRNKLRLRLPVFRTKAAPSPSTTAAQLPITATLVLCITY